MVRTGPPGKAGRKRIVTHENYTRDYQYRTDNSSSRERDRKKAKTLAKKKGIVAKVKSAIGRR